jgi:D-aminopeptidase
VTAVLPHSGNLYREKVPAGIFVGNGFGKLTGSTQVDEMGDLETPILLTSTTSVPRVADALVSYMLSLPGNEEHAKGGPVEEGDVGAGTGTVAFGWKGGIGTASRRLPSNLGGYTIGVLVQTNFGGVLTIAGTPVGETLGQYYLRQELKQAGSGKDKADGSCMIVVATDAPMDARNLRRLAARAWLGVARTGSSGSNGSGDYAIAFSAAPQVRVRGNDKALTRNTEVMANDAVSPLFLAVIEATEEAVYNSMFKATTMTGNGHTVEALPIEKTLEILKAHRVIK